MRTARLSALLIILLAVLLLTSPPARGMRAALAVTDCEGDACSQVTITFDDAKQQFRAQSNSTDRWVRVSASNLAASASACLGPGKEGYLALKSIVGPYRADYSEPRCGGL
jgi:hypothetical protein